MEGDAESERVGVAMYGGQDGARTVTVGPKWGHGRVRAITMP